MIDEEGAPLPEPPKKPEGRLTRLTNSILDRLTSGPVDPGRRKFLQRAGATALVGTAVAIGGPAATEALGNPVGKAFDALTNAGQKQDFTPIPTAIQQSNEGQMQLLESKGEINIHLGEQKEVPLSQDLQWVPDTHIPFQTVNGHTRMWLPVQNRNYLLEGDPQTLLTNPPQNPQEVFRSSGQEYDNNYNAISSVIRHPSGSLLGFSHMEHKDNMSDNGFRASVGLSICHDEGQTWEQIGPILTGKKTRPSSEGASGAGQPCAIINGDSIYVYYTDWNQDEADSIHLARAPLDSLGKAGSWETYSTEGFVAESEKKSDAVIKPPEGAVYIALAGVSFNEKLGKFVSTFEGDNGFYLTTSTDGINWDNYQQITEFPQRQSERKKGDEWYSYPSLLSLDKSSDNVTGDTGVLAYSHGKWEETPHRMSYREFNLT